ncbi:hypothetical protein [Vibrio ziniensis]|uniref:Uncharacterized protein n=1 Tax=Vibrio ziniensis TaxID=2711221 RepID=A0A6G7CNI5_9VIBR|nr:hypothetical protein [Vibrio ziniensis]QIH43634.1 hypothetical protein G5S32_16735 [Vibrio ziniensis]
MRSVLKLLAIFIALLAGFFASDIIKLFSEKTKNIDLSQYCVLSTTPCIQKGISMSLAQPTVHPLVANRLTVSWPNSEAQQLVLSLEGVEMEMGTVKYVLKKVESDKFETDIILPVCTNDSMTWVGQLSDSKTTVLPALRMER